MSRLISYDDIKALDPCWDDIRLRDGVSSGVTAAQIAASNESDADKVWVLSRLLASTTQGRCLLVALVTGYAADSVLLSCPDNDAAWCAIGAATAFAAGEPWADADAYAASAAAFDATASAASAAAFSAAAAAAYAASAAAAAASAHAAFAAADAAAAAPAECSAFINDMAHALDWLLNQ